MRKFIYFHFHNIVFNLHNEYRKTLFEVNNFNRNIISIHLHEIIHSNTILRWHPVENTLFYTKEGHWNIIFHKIHLHFS